MQDFCLTWDPQHLCPLSETTGTSDTQLGDFFRILFYSNSHIFCLKNEYAAIIHVHSHQTKLI